MRKRLIGFAVTIAAIAVGVGILRITREAFGEDYSQMEIEEAERFSSIASTLIMSVAALRDCDLQDGEKKVTAHLIDDMYNQLRQFFPSGEDTNEFVSGLGKELIIFESDSFPTLACSQYQEAMAASKEDAVTVNFWLRKTFETVVQHSR